MSEPKGPILDRPAGPAETGRQPEGRARRREPIPPGVVRYETSDVEVGPVLKAVGGLVVGTLLVVVMVLPVFSLLRSRATGNEPPVPPMGRLDPNREPPEPRLQRRPVQDLADIRAQDDTLLAGYGWVDEQAGVVRIPIEEAMRLIVERGAGAPAAGAAGPASAGVPSPGPGASAAPPFHAAGAR